MKIHSIFVNHKTIDMRKYIIILLFTLVLPVSAQFKCTVPEEKPNVAVIPQTQQYIRANDFNLGDLLEDLNIGDFNLGDVNIGKLLSLTKFYGELKDDTRLTKATEKFFKTLKTGDSKKIKKAGKTFKKKITKSCHRYFKSLAKEAKTAAKNENYKTALKKYETINEMYDALSGLLPDLKNKYQDKYKKMKMKVV